MPTNDSPLQIAALRSLSLELGQGGGGLSGGTAALGWSLSSESEGSTLTITTDGTFTFGTKPVSAKPRFVWRADGGEAPDPVLGVDSVWDDGGFVLENGTASTEQVGLGQSQSYVLDHGASTGAVLAPVRMGSQRKKLIHRRRYEDFDVITATAIRTRVVAPLTSGTIPSPGDVVTGSTSGATGVVQRVDDDTVNGRWAIYYEPVGGTINGENPADFQSGETMTWAAGSGENQEGSGTFRTFNNKVIRLYPLNKTSNFVNVYCGDGQPGYTPSRPQQVAESVGDTGGITNGAYSQLDFARQWNTELFLFQESSAVDVGDASMRWEKNNVVIADGSVSFVSKTTANPLNKETVYQAQVSNGAQPDTKSFYDYLYVDDSWHFVRLRDEVTGRFILLPATTWSSSEITLHYLPYINWTHIDIFKDGVLEGSVSR